MSERHSNVEVVEWLVVEKPLDLSRLCFITSRILVEYEELSFEEIMLTLNYIFVGCWEGKSVLSLKYKNNYQKDFCHELLNNLVKIMKKLTMRSSKMFEMFKDSASDNANFGMSAILLRIIRPICDHVTTTMTNNLPKYVGMEYHRLIVPSLTGSLTADFHILKLWLYDFICDKFSSHDDFRVLVNNSQTKIRSTDLPHHPCNGPFKEDMKMKFEKVKLNIGRNKYVCVFCKCLLNDLGDIVIWADCEHVCYCGKCARLMFIGKIISKPVGMEVTEDGSNVQKSYLNIQNKCPKCSKRISEWSIGRYFGENIVDLPDFLPSARTLLELEYESLHWILKSSWKQCRPVSYVLPLILHATVNDVDMKYKMPLNSELNLRSFKLYRTILLQLCSGSPERGNSYLVQINIRCLKEAVHHFRNNLSWYSGPHIEEEFLSVLNQIGKALADLEKKFVTGTTINSA